MHLKNKLSISLVAMFSSWMLMLPATAQVTSTSDSVNAYVKHQMVLRQIPGLQLAIIRHGSIIKTESFGIANLEDSVAVNHRTVFSINSITKAFTGVAVMQLAEAGKLNITSPISQYLDSLPADWRSVTIQQLLTHMSGLPDAMDPETEAWRFNAVGDDGWMKILKLPMDAKPGERFSYNQTNYVLLGMLIEKLSGQPFTEYFKQFQFKVADMPYTGFGDFYDVVPHKSKSYRLNGGGKFQSNFETFPFPLRTASGINSTAEDMAHWIIALQSGKLLAQKVSLQTLWTPGKLNDGKLAGFGYLLNGYALGWTTMTRPEHPAVGGVGGGRAAFFIYPEDDLAIVILTNKLRSGPEGFADDIAAFYVPEMKNSTGFNLSPNIKIFRKAIGQQFDKADKILKALKTKNPDFQPSENELNSFGYFLMERGKLNDAIAIFKLNVALHQQSGNAYDSLAEAYMTLGNKPLAVKNYKMSLVLNPQNTNGEEQLKKLQSH